MGEVVMPGSSGTGVGSDECTAVLANVLEDTTAITHDSNDEPGNGGLSKNKVLTTGGGNIATKNDSGNVQLDETTTSKSYAAGYYPNAHGAKITTQTKTVTPSTSQQVVEPDATASGAETKKVLKKVTVNAIPNQHADSGNVQLTSQGANVSYPAGWYANAHGAVASFSYAEW